MFAQVRGVYGLVAYLFSILLVELCIPDMPKYQGILVCGNCVLHKWRNNQGMFLHLCALSFEMAEGGMSLMMWISLI
jgi:hypothetical protein